MTGLQLLDEYGPIVGLALLFFLALLPVIRDKLVPTLIELLKSREEFQRQIELDRLASAKKTDDNINMLAITMAETNARIAQILQNQLAIQERENDILETLHEGMTAMRESVARREGYDRGKKEHQRGDTGPLKSEG